MSELGELGLSSYEEKVYRSLLVTGTTTATELSEISAVPKGRIYDVLNGLEARRLIKMQSSDPNQYAALQPETVVDRLLAERAYELKQEWNRYRTEAETIRSNLPPTPPTESSFWLGSIGNEKMRIALQQHMRAAEEVVHTAVGTPHENIPWETLQTGIESFFHGVSTDLTVNLLVSEKVATVLPDEIPRVIENHSADVTIRTRPDVLLSFDVIDTIEATIDIPHPVSGEDRIGVMGIKEARIVNEFEQYFQQLWADADSFLG